jgi:hypothetical protein
MPARLDFSFAVLVSLIAYGLYFLQTIKGIQIADLQRGTKILSFVIGFVIGTISIIATFVFQMVRTKPPMPLKLGLKDFVILFFVLLFLIVLAIFFAGPVRWTLLPGILIGMAFAITPLVYAVIRVKTDSP